MMNRVVLGAIAIAAASTVLIGTSLAYGGYNADPSNSILSNATVGNTISFAGHSAMVECSMQHAVLTQNSPVRCGNWSLTLLGTSNAIDNLSTATFAVSAVEANGTLVPMRTVDVLSGVSGRACLHYEGNDDSQGNEDNVAMSDEGMGVGHSCIFINLESVSPSGAATVQLVGLSFIRPSNNSMHGQDNGTDADSDPGEGQEG